LNVLFRFKSSIDEPEHRGYKGLVKFGQRLLIPGPHYNVDLSLSETVEVATKIVSGIIGPNAAKNDVEARFPTEAILAMGEAGLLGLTVPRDLGGQGLGPRAFADVTTAIAEADASTALVYTMHMCGTACILKAPNHAKFEPILRQISVGKHLTTLAFSERGSRSHFWAPISQAQLDGDNVRITAHKSWVTSASHADSYVITTRSHLAKTPLDSTLYFLDSKAPGVRVASKWNGMGLRANDSAAVELENCLIPAERRLTEEGAGFKAKVETVLPLFNLGCAATSLGICRAAVKATSMHLRNSKFEDMGGVSLGEALPVLRSRLGLMQMETDGLAARIQDYVSRLENSGSDPTLYVLESKAASNQVAINVTANAMLTCGGAAFSGHTGIDRLFRDAQAGQVMAPTVDVTLDLIAKALLGLPLF